MSVSHDEWYQQRYGAAKQQRQHRENLTKQVTAFAAIKEHHQARKATYQGDAGAIFAEHGISYEERGHGWLCSVGYQFIYYWPKSER